MGISFSLSAVPCYYSITSNHFPSVIIIPTRGLVMRGAAHQTRKSTAQKSGESKNGQKDQTRTFRETTTARLLRQSQASCRVCLLVCEFHPDRFRDLEYAQKLVMIECITLSDRDNSPQRYPYSITSNHFPSVIIISTRGSSWDSRPIKRGSPPPRNLVNAKNGEKTTKQTLRKETAA